MNLLSFRGVKKELEDFNIVIAYCGELFLFRSVKNTKIMKL